MLIYMLYEFIIYNTSSSYHASVALWTVTDSEPGPGLRTVRPGSRRRAAPEVTVIMTGGILA
jgi:hypothetical protein